MESNNPAILDLIARYKAHVREHGMKDEVYKWMLIERYRGRPNPRAADFNAELRAVKFENLLYPISLGVLRHLSKEKPVELAGVFRNLFEETRPLQDRIADYVRETKQLYATIEPGKSSHQDERTASVLLTYNAPDQYPLYKDSFYSHFCDLLGIKPKQAGSKYTHFLELLEEFISKYIAEDLELLNLVRSNLPSNAYADPNHLLLAQDILYISSTKGIRYWLFQCHPDQYDIVSALNSETLDNWTVNAHKEAMRSGDRAIIWVTGEEAGCYALAEVTEEPHERLEADQDPYWKDAEKHSGWVVGLEVTHNLADKPVLWELLRQEPGLEEVHRGLRGTNFAAKPAMYEAIVRLAGSERSPGRAYWLFAPGQGGRFWDDFLQRGVAAIDWPLGDLRRYVDREAMRRQMQANMATVSSKKNDTNACWEFTHLMRPGDIIIAKRGRTEFLGWGIVTSEYQFDQNSTHFPHIRKVDWIRQGPWRDQNIVLKTLTNITPYKEYVVRLSALMGIDEYLKTQPQNMTSFPLNTILYGPPGTGKTFHTISKALEIMEVDTKDMDRKHQKAEFQKLQDAGRIAFVTFHQSMSYEDFVEGIKPTLNSGEEELGISYSMELGIFRRICAIAGRQGGNFLKVIEAFKSEVSEIEGKQPVRVTTPGTSFDVKYKSGRMLYVRPQNSTKPDAWYPVSILHIQQYHETENLDGTYNVTYVRGITEFLTKQRGLIKGHRDDIAPLPHLLIIDEINRGNVSQIFGELITLIEEDKRAGNEEALTVTLPYSKEPFSVPKNLYILGTMNTADRSVEALDTALRRRFEFVEMAPRPEKLRKNPEDDKSEWLTVNGIRLCDILYTLNLRIEKLLDRDHCIGHAYFMGVDSPEKLQTAFQHKIIPLLQEYFYGDYAKIGLVLGKGFVTLASSERDNADDLFADFQAHHRHDLARREIWHLRDVGSMSEDTFLEALKSMKIKPFPGSANSAKIDSPPQAEPTEA